MSDFINLFSAHEARQLQKWTQPFILPVTIVTGFLGAGKTTLLQHLMRSRDSFYKHEIGDWTTCVWCIVMVWNQRNIRLATLVNDFGSFNYDGDLLDREKPSRMFKLHDGCMCCSSQLAENMKRDIWDLLQTPDGTEGAVDYLLIETSGVTDPIKIIATLDQRFGKMTRARLDSVVTVLDADTLAWPEEGQSGHGTLTATFRSQLRYADVILLNKADLCSPERLDAAEAMLREVNCTARIYRTQYAQIPLVNVLDVELPDTKSVGVSHEATAAHFTIAGQGRLRSTQSQEAGKSAQKSGSSSSAQSSTHVVEDEFTSFTFESTTPFSMAKFQAFVSKAWPEEVVRSKGCLFFHEGRHQRLLWSMSGRRRFALDDDGTWSGRPATKLAFIGRNMDEAGIEAALVAACAHDGSRPASPLALSCTAEIWALVRANAGIEIIRESDRATTQVVTGYPHVIAFRLSGAATIGLTSEELHLKHGVDLDAMNRDFQRRVNQLGRRDGLILRLVIVEDSEGGGMTGVCFAVGEQDVAYYREAWRVVEGVAAEVAQTHLGRLRLCKCGH